MASSDAEKAIIVNREIARQLREMAEVESFDRWRKRAYEKAAARIEKRREPITSGSQAAREIEDVGKGIGERIDQILQTGQITELRNLDPAMREKLDVEKLFKTIYGVGKVTARKWYEQKYRTLQDLAAKYPEMTHGQQLGYYFYNDLIQKIPRGEIDAINAYFHSIYDPLGIKFVIAGSYRRGAAESGDIDMLVENPANDESGYFMQKVLDPLNKSGFIVGDLAIGKKSKYMGIVRAGNYPDGRPRPVRRFDIRLISPASWPFALLYFTGSKNFNIEIRNRALAMGLSLSEYRFETLQGQPFVPPKPIITEKDIFDLLQVKYLEPNERTDTVLLTPLAPLSGPGGMWSGMVAPPMMLNPAANLTPALPVQAAARQLTGKWFRPVESLFIYVTDGLASYTQGGKQPTVAAFDLDHTLTHHRSGATFAKSLEDIAVMPRRLEVLRDLISKRYLIVIFTNQSAISEKVRENHFRRVDHAIKLLNLPVMLLMATAKDQYRKPQIGMWTEMMKITGAVNKAGSFYCGDAAGRSGDHSDSDLKFAQNIGITFYLPEQAFGV